jgi:drug/metabolite transporter (DMT)-like permease
MYQLYNLVESNPLLGNLLIILSQLLFSLMFIYEEQILKKYEVRVENAVFWEGIWGVIISGIALALFSVI